MSKNIMLVRLPDYWEIRVFLYKGVTFINISAPKNGLVLIVTSTSTA